MVKMKNYYWLFLLFIIACAIPKASEPAVQIPAPVQRDRAILYAQINKNIINEAIPPYDLVSTDAIYDNFAIIPVERYDARYQSTDINVLVHIFKFSTREELDFVLNSAFYDIIDRGSQYHNGHAIATFLTLENERIAVWPSGNTLVYIITFIPDFAAREIVNSYLIKYPSDLQTKQCYDSDGNERFVKGNTNRVMIGSTLMEWTDTCLRDFALYRNKQYASRKGLSEDDGLLEGACQMDNRQPGVIIEYACPRRCMNGACTLS